MSFGSPHKTYIVEGVAMADRYKTSLQDVELQPQEHIEDFAKQKALIRKQDLRIVPLSAGIYLLCYLDRSNIGKFLVFSF